MAINWSKVRKEDLIEASRRFQLGEHFSKRDEQLAMRQLDIEAFLGDRCYYATYQPIILKAMQEVLMRLPEEVWDFLVNKRDVRVFFPESVMSTFYSHLVLVRTDPKSEYGEHEMSHEMSFVVLSCYLNESSHKNAVGTIAHEFAHVYLEHSARRSKDEKTGERRADALACKWGFKEEIDESKRGGPSQDGREPRSRQSSRNHRSAIR